MCPTISVLVKLIMASFFFTSISISAGLEYCKNKNEDYNNLPAILFRAILFFIIDSKTSREVLFSAPV